MSTQGKRSNQVQEKFPSQGPWKGGGEEGSADEGADYEEEAAAAAAAATASKEEAVQVKTTVWQAGAVGGRDLRRLRSGRGRLGRMSSEAP